MRMFLIVMSLVGRFSEMAIVTSTLSRILCLSYTSISFGICVYLRVQNRLLAALHDFFLPRSRTVVIGRNNIDYLMSCILDFLFTGFQSLVLRFLSLFNVLDSAGSKPQVQKKRSARYE